MEIVFFIQIMNQGGPLKSFANASLNIYWPKENSVGKWLLYLTQITSERVQSVSCSPVHEINPLKHMKVVKHVCTFSFIAVFGHNLHNVT